MNHKYTTKLFFFLYSLIGICSVQLSNAQPSGLVCPELNIIGGPVLNLSCNTYCTNIQARLPIINESIDGANAYTVTNIPFSGNYGFAIPGASPLLVNQDDRFSPL